MGLIALVAGVPNTVSQAGVEALLPFTFGSDADATLSAPQAAHGIIAVTGAVISATRKLIYPLTAGQVLFVDNQEGHSVTVIGATGTGITVATTKHAIVYCDGTNWIRITADT